jgi:hypothetical protein
MRALPRSPIDVSDQRYARMVAGWLWGVGNLLGGFSLVGLYLLALFTGGEFDGLGLVFLVCLVMCVLGSLPIFAAAMSATLLDARGGRVSWREDQAAEKLAAEELGREPTAKEVLRVALRAQKEGLGMRPETIHRYLTARGSRPPQNEEDRKFLRELRMHMVKVSWKVKAAVLANPDKTLERVEMMTQSYLPMELNRASREVSERLTAILGTERPGLFRTCLPPESSDE